jgi:hypothetical protein
MVFNAAGPFVASIAFDRLGSYTLIFTVFAGLLMVSSVLMLLATPPDDSYRGAALPVLAEHGQD